MLSNVWHGMPHPLQCKLMKSVGNGMVAVHYLIPGCHWRSGHLCDYHCCWLNPKPIVISLLWFFFFLHLCALGFCHFPCSWRYYNPLKSWSRTKVSIVHCCTLESSLAKCWRILWLPSCCSWIWPSGLVSNWWFTCISGVYALLMPTLWKMMCTHTA